LARVNQLQKIKLKNMYIIKIKTKVNGAFEIAYHENITINNPKNGAINTYVEHITTDKKKALQFFEKEEAERLAQFFKYSQYRVINK
jgi:hypothetical protein